MAKSGNTLITFGLLFLGYKLFFGSENTNTNSVGGNGTKTIDQVKASIKRNKNKGNEHIVNDSLHYGVSENVYAYVNDLKKAGVSFMPSQNPLFGYLQSNIDIENFLNYLENKDGYLYVSK